DRAFHFPTQGISKRHQNFRPDSCTATGPQQGLRRTQTPFPTTTGYRCSHVFFGASPGEDEERRLLDNPKTYVASRLTKITRARPGWYIQDAAHISFQLDPEGGGFRAWKTK
ncbi:unnamed protein product, partial [Scytosiphon promiscuus]